MTIADLVDDPKKTHHPCPYCPSSDAFTIDPEKGDTGVGHCHSCGAGCTGAQMYAHVMHVPISEALSDMGVEGDDSRPRKAARAHRRRRQTRMQRLEARAIETERLRPYMTSEEEEWLLTLGSLTSNPTDEERRHADWATGLLLTAVWRRARAEMEDTDRIDANYHPQDTQEDERKEGSRDNLHRIPAREGVGG